MANEGLLGVPMSFGVGDTLAGSLGAGLGAATPTMISPYASTGTAIGVGLGSILLQSLLGYQARQQAAERTLELNRLSTSLLGMKDAQERSDFIGTLGDTDPLVLGRLGSLSGALAGQEIQQQRALDLERQKQMLGYELELSPEAQQVADLNQERKIAEIKARNAGFTSRLGSVLSGPTNEMQQFINTYFDPRISVKARTDLQFLTKEQIEAVKSGKLSPSEAMQIARRKSNEEERYEMQKQRKEFVEYKTFMDQNYKDLPTAIRNDVGKNVAIYDRALNLSKLVAEKIKNIPELQLEKRFTSDSGFREEFKDFTDLVQRARTGAAAPYVEQLNLQAIVSGTINATPQQVSKMLSEFARRIANDSYERVLTAKTPDNQLIAQLDNMRTNLAPFSAKIPKLETPSGQQTFETPTAQTNESTITQDDRQLLERYRQGIANEDLKAKTEAVLKSKGLL